MKMTEQDFANHPSDTAMADKYFREAEYLRAELAKREDDGR